MMKILHYYTLHKCSIWKRKIYQSVIFMIDLVEVIFKRFEGEQISVKKKNNNYDFSSG